MDVILLERVAKLGQMGEVVRVKNGFARNYLLPKGKALRATKENRDRFEGMKAELEVRNAEARGEAEETSKKVDGKSIVVLRQAGESGLLYGSVSSRDIAGLLSGDGLTVNRSQVVLNAPIKAIGIYKVPVALHPEVEVMVTVTVARSAEEAERIGRGEDVTVRREEREEAEEPAAAAEEVFFRGRGRRRPCSRRLAGRCGGWSGRRRCVRNGLWRLGRRRFGWLGLPLRRLALRLGCRGPVPRFGGPRQARIGGERHRARIMLGQNARIAMAAGAVGREKLGRRLSPIKILLRRCRTVPPANAQQGHCCNKPS
jgi:large subunit ribosomal protein L9